MAFSNILGGPKKPAEARDFWNTLFSNLGGLDGTSSWIPPSFLGKKGRGQTKFLRERVNSLGFGRKGMGHIRCGGSNLTWVVLENGTGHFLLETG